VRTGSVSLELLGLWVIARAFLCLPIGACAAVPQWGVSSASIYLSRSCGAWFYWRFCLRAALLPMTNTSMRRAMEI